jgi:hypothetical protein
MFERTPIPAAKRPAADQIFNNLMLTLAQAEDYPPLLRRAGLRFEEILDISEHSIPKSRAWLSELTNEIRSNFEAMFGDEMARRLDVSDDVIDMPELGYLMLVAKRPKALSG